jgi:hypothetical protein
MKKKKFSPSCSEWIEENQHIIMTSFLSAADEWLEVAAQGLKDLHPDWTHDRPIR